MYKAKIICDSISETGKRLTTFEITFPRIVLAEFNTHRMFSRNSASSRAIPIQKQIQRVLDNPFIPERFLSNGIGMQPNSYFEKGTQEWNNARDLWIAARNNSVKYADELYKQGIHKQISNRLLEPFLWHTVICTATEFDNFFKLRTNKQAQYEIRRIADLMYDAHHLFVNTDERGLRSRTHLEPKLLKQGEWHLPFISNEDIELIKESVYKFSNEHLNDSAYKYTPELIINTSKKVSVARCARVSYLTHDGKRDIEKDLELFEKLRTSGHWSPFEHVATPYFNEEAWKWTLNNIEKIPDDKYEHLKSIVNISSGNFIGWKQYRKEFQDENCNYFRKEYERYDQDNPNKDTEE